METHQLLLESTSSIINEFYHQRKGDGEFFNLYSLLGIEHRENETHSVLLADLLSPDGSHGQKDRFLQLFFETLEIEVENTKFAKVSREFSIGKINDSYTEGGRIDILIEMGNEKWLIENKLYAQDQKNQLERYHYSFPKATIFYLTLDGKKYHQKTDFDVVAISYEKSIVKWLEKILEEIKDKEYLTNSIKQYYNLIKNITFSGHTQEMENKICENIKSSKENLESAFQIYNNYETSVKSLLSENIVALKKKFENKGFSVLENTDWYKSNFYFYKEDWKSRNICVGLEFETNLKNPFVGITLFDTSKNIDIGLRQSIVEHFDDKKTTEVWASYKTLLYFTNVYDWNDAVKLKDGTFIENVEKDLFGYVEILNDLIK